MGFLIFEMDSVGIRAKYGIDRACPDSMLTEMNLTTSGLHHGITHHGDFEKMSCHITGSFLMLIRRLIPIGELMSMKCRNRLVSMVFFRGFVLTGLMQMTCACCRESMGYGGFRE